MTKVADLVSRVDALETLVGKLNIDGESKSVKTIKKQRNMTEKGEIHNAKLLYYHEMKDTNAVKIAYKKEHGDELKLSFKNWTQVKKITDVMFDNLSSSVKDKYVVHALNAKLEESSKD